MIIGVDLGGTKIEAVALDREGRERFRERVPTPKGDYAGTLAAIRGLVSEIDRRFHTRGLPVGIGTPGAISPRTGLLKNSNSAVLNGKPLDKDLAKALRRPVRLANDADCFALSEAFDGAGAGFRVVFGVILGTGVGGGIVVDGRILNGPNAISGEWGHNPLPWPRPSELPGPSCSCGRRGCIESFLCGPALQRDGGRHYVDRLARALAHVINILDPDVIVLGGGVSNVARLYRNVPKLWGRWVFSDHVATRLLKARHGDSSGVRGAARLCAPRTGFPPDSSARGTRRPRRARPAGG